MVVSSGSWFDRLLNKKNEAQNLFEIHVDRIILRFAEIRPFAKILSLQVLTTKLIL